MKQTGLFNMHSLHTFVLCGGVPLQYTSLYDHRRLKRGCAECLSFSLSLSLSLSLSIHSSCGAISRFLLLSLSPSPLQARTMFVLHALCCTWYHAHMRPIPSFRVYEFHQKMRNCALTADEGEAVLNETYMYIYVGVCVCIYMWKNK